MEYEEIRQCLADCRFSGHARREMKAAPDCDRGDPEFRERRQERRSEGYGR